jgi:hypothetical protein
MKIEEYQGVQHQILQTMTLQKQIKRSALMAEDIVESLDQGQFRLFRQRHAR